MLDYFVSYYVERNFGPGYVVTNIAYVIAVVLLLSDTKGDARGVLRKAGECALCWLATVVYCSIYCALFGHSWMDPSMMALFLVGYAVFRSRYRPITRLVRSCVFYACVVQSLTLSEPVGELLEDLGFEVWVENLTWVIMVLLAAASVALLRRFSIEALSFIPTFPAVLVVAVSGMGVLLQWTSSALDSSKAYHVLVAGCFWLLELLSYYMFYMVSKEYDRNLELMALHHKEELDEELLQFSRENFEELHIIRHEVHNHMAYLRALSEAGEYERLNRYLSTVSGEIEGVFRFVECGNDVVNAVMNHAIRQANACGIQVEQQIVVPPKLPYQETELCSLLSNLMNNAIEAAAKSGEQRPVITVQIRPQQDYLFIRVTNPVDNSIPPRHRLTLRTTKEDKRVHGYGTKIIRRVAERYQGSVGFDIRDGRFVADVMLYLEEERQNGEAVSGNL